MAVLNLALLAAILPAVFASPQHVRRGHGPYKGTGLPSGFPTGFPHPSGVPGTAPYPAQNSTVGGPTGSGVASTGGYGQGPVTIQSTINVVPYPSTKTEYAASSTGGVGESGASSSAGSGPGVGESGSTCGPATVTVTQANTVTVTVPGSNGGAPSNAPIQSSPASSASLVATSAPYPVGNSSVPVGPSGTASVGTGLPSVPHQVPIPVTSSAQTSSAAPSEAATSASSSAAGGNTYHVTNTVVPTSSVIANAYYHAPEHHQSSSPVVAPSSSSVSFPAPVASTSATSAPASSQVSSSAPAASSSSAPVSSGNTGVKARGLLYGGTPGSTAISNANAFIEGSSGAIGWGTDWDSSPSPQSGDATGTLNVQFVPQLLSTASVHTGIWDSNSAGHPYLMGFNEPDTTTAQGGSQMDYDTCASSWMTYMEPKRSGSTKLVSPATTNNLDDAAMGVQYMANFLKACITDKGCHIDVLAFHYYGEASDLQALKTTVQKYQALQTQYKIPELWISEMAPNEAPTADQMSAFLTYLDDESNGIARYAFNGLNTGTGQSLDNSVMKTAYQA